MTVHIRHIIEYSNNKTSIDSRQLQNEWDYPDQNSAMTFLSQYTNLNAFHQTSDGFLSDWYSDGSTGFMREEFRINGLNSDIPLFFVVKSVEGDKWDLCTASPVTWATATSLRNQLLESSPKGTRIRIIDFKTVD